MRNFTIGLVISVFCLTIPGFATGGHAVSGNTDNNNQVRHPFQAECSADTDAQGIAQCTIATVPRGKLLVIEMFSGILELNVGDRPNDVTISTTINGFAANHWFVSYLTGTDASLATDFITVAQQTRIYAGPGTGVLVTTVTHSGPLHIVDFTVSGYLVDK